MKRKNIIIIVSIIGAIVLLCAVFILGLYVGRAIATDDGWRILVEPFTRDGGASTNSIIIEK